MPSAASHRGTNISLPVVPGRAELPSGPFGGGVRGSTLRAQRDLRAEPMGRAPLPHRPPSFPFPKVAFCGGRVPLLNQAEPPTAPRRGRLRAAALRRRPSGGSGSPSPPDGRSRRRAEEVEDGAERCSAVCRLAQRDSWVQTCE